MMIPCPFCEIVACPQQARVVFQWDDALAFVPLNPVTDGHLLVVPLVHVSDALEDPDVTGQAMARAAELAQWAAPNWSCNLITSTGAEASQTVYHLHVHMVPRRPGDGLSLPWGKVQR